MSGIAVLRVEGRLFEEGIVDGLGAVDRGQVAEAGPAEAVGEALEEERFALVLGGTFSSVIGALPALRPRGGLGLLHIGPEADLSVVLDAPGARGAAGAGMPDAIGIVTGERVRAVGPDAAAREALAVLARAGERLRGFWIHLDVAALDDAVMQAVAEPNPDGMAWGELAAVLGLAIGWGRAVGLQVAGYDPLLDPSGTNGRALARTVNTVLAEFT